jgi:hypothetical protein
MAQTIFETKRGGFSKRISWGAIFAGVVVVLAVQLMLSLLGAAFGAGSINPLQEDHPTSGLGVWSAIWLGISTLVALFAGGWISARMAAIPDRTESALHGVITWGLTSLVGAYLITTAVSGVLSGAAGLFGKTAGLLGQTVQSVAPEIASAVAGEASDNGFNWSKVKSEAETLLRQTKKPALQPEAIERQATGATNDAKSTASDMARGPQESGQDIAALWSRIEARGDRIIDAVDQTALVNVLVARTDMTRQEATATVVKWQQTLSEGKQKFAEAKANAGHKAREIADTTASVVSNAAAWSFVALLLGLISAGIGGYLGSPFKGNTVELRRQIVTPAESAA